nr:unnamed protein product [Callosobruchus chinensis]
MEGIFGLMLVLIAAVQKASALQCWKCSSDIDPMCNDRFNQSDILARRGGGLYSPLTQRQPYDQQGYNQNYNPNYNPNYNQNYNNNYNPAAQSSSWPILDNCDDNEARLRRMKNVCMKKVIRGPGYSSIIRRCAIIPPEQTVGTCHEPVSRGLSLEFCEYCDYDGCNSATGLKTNYILLGSILAMLGFILSH